MKRIISVLFAIAMFVGLVPTFGPKANAEGETQYKVLYWCAEVNNPGHGDFIPNLYSEMGDVTVVTKTSGALTQSELNGVQLVYIFALQTEASSTVGQNVIGAADLLKTFVANGGRVIMNGETNGLASQGNATLTALANAMGGNFTILNDSSSETNMVFNTTGKPSLTAGLTSDFYPNSFAPISSTNANTVWVVKSGSGKVFVLDQKVQNGYITALADFNWGRSSDVNRKAQARQFLRNLLLDSAANMDEYAPKAPTVTTSADQTVTYGEPNTNISVTATVDTDKDYTLSYQWYINTTASNENGTAITAATDSSYTIPSDLDVGTYYYYCIVTATYTDNDSTADAASDVITVTVDKAVLDKDDLTDYEKPTANDLTYNGEDQELVTAPETLPDGYINIQYKLSDTEDWLESIPTGLDVGQYIVNVKYVGDDNHLDFEGDDIIVTIAENKVPEPEKEVPADEKEIPADEKEVLTSEDTPNTGDNSHIELWITLMIICAVSFFGTTVLIKKRVLRK